MKAVVDVDWDDNFDDNSYFDWAREVDYRIDLEYDQEITCYYLVQSRTFDICLVANILT